jgi:hypothetical protein
LDGREDDVGEWWDDKVAWNLEVRARKANRNSGEAAGRFVDVSRTGEEKSDAAGAALVWRMILVKVGGWINGKSTAKWSCQISNYVS